jgi:hypothetical protein
MDDQEEIIFESEDDPLAEPAQQGDFLPGEIGWSGFNRTKDKGVGEPDLIEGMTQYAGLQGLEVNGHIGKFRHASFIMRRMRTFRILFAGWMIGAAVIVLLTMMQPRAKALPAEALSANAVNRDPTVGMPGSAPMVSIPIEMVPVTLIEGGVIVPVAGIPVSGLHDNYLQMRGGGTRTHGAIDIMAPRGTPVVAAVDGTIRKIFTSAGGGLTIYQFDPRQERVYYYAHLDRYAPGIYEGLFVRQGTVIGAVGSTGNAAADAPHLHFAIETLPPTKEWWKGTPMNPYPVLVGSSR